VNGQDYRSNVYLLDGTLQNDFTNGPAGGAAGTALGLESIREFRVESNAYSAFTMLPLHHTNGVLNGAERTREVTAADGRHRQFPYIKKQHLFFLQQMLSEFVTQTVEARCHTGELRVPRAVHLHQFRQVVLNRRHGRPNVLMMRRHDVIDEPVQPPPPTAA
jgi:hypothetical protein